MAQKTFYIKDEDLPLFDKAEKMGLENFSAFVAQSLKKYVRQKEVEAAGLKEFTLQIDNREEEKTVKFTGRLLSEDRRYRGQLSDGKDRWTDWEIYQTRAGKIVVYRAFGSRWQGEENGSSEYTVLASLPDYDTSVFDYGEHVPGSLLEAAAAALGEEKVEYIE